MTKLEKDDSETLMRYFVLVFVLTLLIPLHANATSYHCWDGSLISESAACPPEPPRSKDIVIFGITEIPVTGYLVDQDTLIQTAYDVIDQHGNVTVSFMSHDKRDAEISLELTQFSSDMDLMQNEKFIGKLDTTGFYQFTKEDGSRLAFEECMINSILAKAKANPYSDFEILSSCKIYD